MNERLKYLWRSTRGVLSPERSRCPNCGEGRSLLIKRKYVVTSLRRCSNCRLLFRAPTDPPGFGDEFYQSDYHSGFTTDCPDATTLKQLVDTGFRGTAKDFSSRIELLQALGLKRGARLLDYGASWGYATWQFNQAGFETVGFELSRPRARYARERLGVDVRDNIEEFDGPFDAFFSCHVLEHVPQVSQVFELAQRLLRPGGLFVAITPNGCPEAMALDPGAYHRAWGSVHPQYLDAEFYRHAFSSCPTFVASLPLNLNFVRNWNREQTQIAELTGPELVVAALPHARQFSGSPAQRLAADVHE